MDIDTILILGGALTFGVGSSAFARWSRYRLERDDPARQDLPSK